MSETEEKNEKTEELTEFSDFSEKSQEFNYNDYELSESFEEILKQNSPSGYKFKNIGSGAFSNTLKIHKKDDKQNYVLKINSKNDKENIVGEKIYANKQIASSNLVKTLYCSNTCKNVVMEYFNGKGNLKYLLTMEEISQKRYFNRYNFVLDILNGLKKLEENNLIHNDIKSANIVFNKNTNGSFTFAICDFGLVNEVKENFNLKVCGTLRYMSPEKIISERDKKQQKTNNISSDIWSAGVLFFEIMTDNEIYQFTKNIRDKIELGVNNTEIQKYINFAINRYTKNQFKTFKPLLISMLKVNPEERLTTDECLKLANQLNPSKGSTDQEITL